MQTMMINGTETQVHMLNDAALARLEERFIKLNKVAAKLGTPAASFQVVADEVVKVAAEDGESYLVHVNYITVAGVAPKLGDEWVFCATLQHEKLDSGELANIVRLVPGQSITDMHRSVDNTHCDWCHTKRFRKDTFVVRNTVTGEFAHVGSDCIKNYLGHLAPSAVAAMLAGIADTLEIIEELDGATGFGGFSLNDQYINTLDYMTNVCAVARKFGFMTKSQAEVQNGTATSVVAFDNFRMDTNRAKLQDWYVRPIDADRAYAQLVIDHVRGLQLGDNDYINNLIVAFQKETNRRNVGLVASAYVVYKRFIEGEAQRKQRAASQHVGTVGAKKVPLTVTVVSVTPVDSTYGTSFKHLMKSGDDMIIWWCSNGANALDEGAQYNITCTIKDHDEWRGNKQTTVKLVKVVG